MHCADHHPQFHFATVLSPWIRRALIAGGFGIGAATPSTPIEIAQVVSLGDVRDTPDEKKLYDIESPQVSEVMRSGGDLKSPTSEIDDTNDDPITLPETPFFHFDLASAVRAAESSLARRSTSESSTSKSEDSVKVALSGHDIITTEVAPR